MSEPTGLAEVAQKMRKRMEERGIKPATPEQLARAANPPRCDFQCPECGGTGYVYTHPDAKPADKDFGAVRVCSRYRAKLLKQQMDAGIFDERTGLVPPEYGMKWDLVKPKISDGVKAVQAVKPKLEQGHGMVLLIGAFGQGKTLVGKILVAEALRRGWTAAYANMARILDDIRLAFDSQEMKSTELLRKMEWWNSLRVLFIDELDKMNRTDWAQERMFELLDRRYTRAVREEALTVVATNSPAGELDGYLRSRLSDNRLGPIVELQGVDGRLSVPKSHRF